jgi:hypothetical protein
LLDLVLAGLARRGTVLLQRSWDLVDGQNLAAAGILRDNGTLGGAEIHRESRIRDNGGGNPRKGRTTGDGGGLDDDGPLVGGRDHRARPFRILFEKPLVDSFAYNLLPKFRKMLAGY